MNISVNLYMHRHAKASLFQFTKSSIKMKTKFPSYYIWSSHESFTMKEGVHQKRGGRRRRNRSPITYKVSFFQKKRHNSITNKAKQRTSAPHESSQYETVIRSQQSGNGLIWFICLHIEKLTVFTHVTKIIAIVATPPYWSTKNLDKL